MHRNSTRSQILYPGLLCLALILFLVPEAEVGRIRGQALSVLSPLLSMCSQSIRRNEPLVASITLSVNSSTTINTDAPTVNHAQELDELRAEKIRMGYEINHLKSALHFPESTKEVSGIPADIIARQILWQEPILALNRGELDGIRLNAGVLHRGAVAGRIVSVGPHVSCMALLTHRGLSISARLVDCRLEGILQGSLEEKDERLCRLAIVGREVQAKIGEQVVTSGYDGVFPPGLWLGVVTSVKKITDVQWELAVRPACKNNAVEIVRVLTVNPPEIPWPAVPVTKRKTVSKAQHK